MKNLQRLLIILLLIIILVTSMMSYKIETFINLTDQNIYPQTPNDYTCYNYIKNIKKWNVDELTKEQQKVLFTMRTLQGTQFNDNNKIFPYKDGCVIPREHLPIFNASIDKTSLTVTPPIYDNNGSKIGEKDNITISYNNNDNKSYPKGVITDFSKMNYNQFKDFLNGAYELYDSDFLINKRILEDELKKQIGIRDYYNMVKDDLIKETAVYNNKRNLLLDINSECQISKLYNNVHLLEYNNLNDQNNIIVNQIKQLWDYIYDGWKQIYKLENCTPPMARFYEACWYNYDYNGYDILLTEGKYSLNDMQRKGITNDTLSSVRVGTNTRVILWEHDNFQGRMLYLTSDTECLINQQFNDIASSIVVESYQQEQLKDQKQQWQQQQQQHQQWSQIQD